VPLVVRFPKGKGPAGVRMQGLVDLLDVAPTVAEIFGASTAFEPGRGVPGTQPAAGRRRRPREDGRALSDRVGSARAMRSATRGTNTSTTRAPGIRSSTTWTRIRQEARNLASEEPILAAYYREACTNGWPGWPSARGGRGRRRRRPTREQCENLKAFGIYRRGMPLTPRARSRQPRPQWRLSRSGEGSGKRLSDRATTP
jgi:hypothetical protein